jgi:hypothetical protein
MTIAEARIAIVRAKIKADKLSAEIKGYRDVLIAHETSKDETIKSFEVVTKEGRIKISKGNSFEKFNSAARSRIPPYEGGRLEIYNHLSPEDQKFWDDNTTLHAGRWTVYLSTKRK